MHLCCCRIQTLAQPPNKTCGSPMNSDVQRNLHLKGLITLRHALAVGLLALGNSAYAQEQCPFARASQSSGTIPVSATIAIAATKYQIIDCSAFQFVATAPDIDPMISITDSPFTAQAIVKLGIVDGHKIAKGGVEITEVALDEIDIKGISDVTNTGLALTGKVFDNFIRVGSIRDVGGNGVLAQTPGDSADYNVQGNHIEIGQISGSGASGLAFLPGAFANTLIVGPVENNKVFGCSDAAAAPANLGNIWIVNGANNNGIPGGRC
jgi:hypothetical protein